MIVSNNGLQTPLLVLGIVIAILLLAILIVLLVFVSRRSKTAKPAPQAAPVSLPVSQGYVPQQDAGELIAVLTAAVMAALDQEGAPRGDGSLVVRSFRRVNTVQSAWAAQGRAEQLN